MSQLSEFTRLSPWVLQEPPQGFLLARLLPNATGGDSAGTTFQAPRGFVKPSLIFLED